MNPLQAGEHAVREGGAGGGVPRLAPPLLLPLLREHHGRREGGKALKNIKIGTVYSIQCCGSGAFLPPGSGIKKNRNPG